MRGYENPGRGGEKQGAQSRKVLCRISDGQTKVALRCETTLQPLKKMRDVSAWLAAPLLADFTALWTSCSAVRFTLATKSTTASASPESSPSLSFSGACSPMPRSFFHWRRLLRLRRRRRRRTWRRFLA